MKKSLVALAVLTMFSGAAAAETIGFGFLSEQRVEAIGTEQQSMSAIDTDSAKAWGLSDAEWLKFKQIMATTPRGIWTPNIDPITALGVEAKTDAERERYARLQIALEQQRRAKEFAFQEAMYRVLRDDYPEHPVWMSTHEARRAKAVSSAPAGMSGLDVRTVLFVPASCDKACVTFAKEVAKAGGTNTQVDVFVVGTGGSNSAIQLVGKQIELDRKKVSEGRITLNHDEGSWERMKTSYPDATLPIALRRGIAGSSLVKP